MSVLIVPVGKAFEPGTWESYEAACAEYTRETGDRAAVETRIEQMCIIPYFGLNAAKNWWACKAKMDGWTHCLFLDNDIQLIGQRFLAAMMEVKQPYVVPYHEADWRDGPNRWVKPDYEGNTGIHEVEWAAVNCVFVDLMLIDQVGPTLFSEAFIFHEDEYTCLRLRAQGIGIWQNTAARVKVLRQSGLIELAERYRKLCNPL